MKLSEAQALVTKTLNIAQREGFNISISIVDTAGLQVMFSRMDGTALGTIDVANKKARTAALFHSDSKALGAVARSGSALYTLENTNGGMISFGGGLVIRNEQGNVIGGLGVAGATLEADEEIAQEALYG
ncbi:GlcG/HbpS family heme-binding protein [Pseudoalteromonas gelatinilytica]